jgi:Methyltransferase domain
MTDHPGNAPRPLANALIPLLADSRSQMSFGERAALEGVLSQLQPKLSVEIGSSSGGTLERVAQYSQTVHSFDLVPPDSEHMKSNICVHTGDSKHTFPEWLSTLDEQIDFALIDGDHTREGVSADLHNLLESECANETLILLHDMAIKEVQEGVDLVIGETGEKSSKVVYYDSEFFPGYTFREGPFYSQLTGGLGIIVTGNKEIDGYKDSPCLTLYEKANLKW